MAQDVQINCEDFYRNLNGTWTSKVHTTINGEAVDPGMAFRPGTVHFGVDVQAWLEEHCR